MFLNTIGRKISRLGDVIQQPRLLKVYLRGVEVRMFESLNKPWLLAADVRTVFDVGANTGQFAKAIHEVLPDAYIYSFEPLTDCFKELTRSMSHVRGFKAFNAALADTSGKAKFHRSQWSPSSSLLRMADAHRENFPFSAGEFIETVEVRRLDDYLDGLTLRDNILLKIDVQGAEDKVIAGASKLLQRTKILIVETSMQVLYDSQLLFSDILRILQEHGFSYKGSMSQLLSPIDDSVLQANSIFIRNV